MTGAPGGSGKMAPRRGAKGPLKAGAATVEFAMLAPLAILMLASCLEVSRIQLASMILERAAYDIAYRSKLAHGQGFEAIAQEVLRTRANGLFLPEEVLVEAQADEDLASVAAGIGRPGGGRSGEVVRLRLEAELGILSNFAPEPLKVRRTIDYYYINEPAVEDGA